MNNLSTNTIKITQISWDNIRNFESLILPGNNEELKNSTSLVQIQNGYGKTTTLYLLRSIFTSKPIDKQFINSGYRYRYPHKNWGGNQDKASKFHVNFEINDEFYRIGLEIDHIRGTQKFTTFSDSLGGEIDGWHPPHIFRRLFQNKNEFAKLFILDGELAKELNRSTGSQVVSNSIQQVTNLSGLHLLVGSSQESDGQIERVKHARLSAAIGSGGAREEKLKNTLELVHEQISRQRKNLTELNGQIDDFLTQISNCNTQKQFLDESLSDNKDALETSKKAEAEAKNDLILLSKNVLERLFKPGFSYPDWQGVQKFHSSQVKAKLPRSVGRTWFRELMELDTCICGRDWDSHSTEFIEQHLEDYLDTRLMTYVKEMQDAVAEHSNSISLGSQIMILQSKQIEKAQKTQMVDDIRSQSSKEDRAEFQRLDQEIGKLTEQLDQYEFMRNEIGSETLEFIKDQGFDEDVYNNDGTVTSDLVKIRRIRNLSCLKIVEKSLVRVLASISGAAVAAAGADLILSILTEVLSKVEEEINIELEAKMNRSLSRMVGAGLNGGLVVKITGNGLQYYSPNGDLQSGVNMAAELGGSYAFISALYEYAEVSLPLVLDTPLAGFGQGMSAAWTQLVPKTFDQVIALINSNEMISLKGWIEKEDVDCYLVRRTDENVTTGSPQTGKMIIDCELNNFLSYESAVYDGGDLNE